MSLVFVYGTLRAGQGNHRCLAGAAFLGAVERLLGFSMVSINGHYPAVYPDEIGSGVVGEVYEVNAETLARLDGLEGYPHHYDRIVVATPYGDAWMYVYTAARAGRYPLVMGGDWCA